MSNDNTKRQGRTPGGQFAPGNQFGKGNPQAQHIARWRASFAEAVTDEDLKATVVKLAAAARAGQPWAVRELLDRCLGRSIQGVQLDGLAVALVVDPCPGPVRCLRAVSIATGDHEPVEGDRADGGVGDPYDVERVVLVIGKARPVVTGEIPTQHRPGRMTGPCRCSSTRMTG